MQIAKVYVNELEARTIYAKKITKGLRGGKVSLEYAGGIWEGLVKNVAFTNGLKTVGIFEAGPEVEIPPEVTDTAGVEILVGVCGVDGTGVVTPTAWASLGEVLEAVPSDFEEADKELTPSVAEQLLSRIGPMDELGTKAKDSLVAAINEVIKLAGGDIDPEVLAAAVKEYLAANPAPETDPTVPAWAKQPTKPGYTAEEVGAVATVNGIAPDESGNVLIPVSGGSGGYVGVEPTEDDIPKIFFDGALQQTKTEAVVPFRYISKTADFSGYAEIKAQGNSSMSYPKKNQTVKLFKDAACTEKLKVDFKGWGKQSKHVYKANWIDLSHARNVVSARLWADVVKSRANYADLSELLRTSPNQGAVDGFPVKVYAAGVYQGRYTLNIPKDKWTFNMDDELDTHCVLCGENYASGCFRAAASINGSDWTDEIHDTVPASIKTRWNEVISFVMNSTDEDFRANLGNYFYVDSLIDYYLFGLASCGLDAFGKNQIYATYDGQKWIASMYDMDSTWGLYWNGSKFVATDYPRTSYEDYVSSGSSGDGNLLYNRLEQLFYEEMQTRWAELKNGALSIENIINRFERFTDIAPAELVKEDYASTTGGGKFTGIPSKDTNNIQQIRAFALARQAWTDEYVEGLTPEAEVPCTGITLSASDLTFTAEGTQTLTATVTPDGCTDAVTWESDDISIATVSGGVVTAKANGSATIAAKCGEHSAFCIVAVSGIETGDDNTDAPADYVYALQETTFDGVDDYVDTGVQLYDTEKDATLFIDFTGENAGATNGAPVTIAHAMYEASPFPGLTIGAAPAGIQYDTVGIAKSTTLLPTTARHRIALVLDTTNKTETMYVDGGKVSGTYTDFTAVTQNLLLGAYQDTSGKKDRFWKGTIHACKVWNRMLTEAEIDTMIAAEDMTLYENYEPNSEAFGTAVGIDFANGDYIEASIDVSNCTGTNKNILSIGEDIYTWGSKNTQHYYYTASSKALKVDGAGGASFTLDETELVLRFDNTGVRLNGEYIAYAANIQTVLNLGIIGIGSVEGNMRSDATYNYIKVVRG